MAISVIGSAKNNVRADSDGVGITVDISGLTLADGDCLFAILGCGDDPGTGWICDADGWASLGSASSTTGNDAAFGAMRHYIETAADEPTSVNFKRVGNTGIDNHAAIVIQVRGVDGVVPTDNADVTFTASNDPTPDNVNITTGADNDAVLIACLLSDAATLTGPPTAVAPSGYSVIDSESYSDGTNVQSIWMAAAIDTDVGSAGAQNIGSWGNTGGASTVEAYTLAISIRQVGAPLADGIYHDRASVSHAITGSISQSSFTWDHDPRNPPAGVLVFCVNMTANADIFTGVTYAGEALAAVSGGAAQDTTTEPGYTKAYFLAEPPATDPATVVVNRTDNTNEAMAYCVSVYSTEGSSAVYEAGIVLLENDGTLTEQSVNDGSPAAGLGLRYAAGYSGLATPPPAGANSISRKAFDTGAFVSALVSEATPGAGSRPVGFAAATDDRAMVHLAVIPVSAVSATPVDAPVLDLVWDLLGEVSGGVLDLDWDLSVGASGTVLGLDWDLSVGASGTVLALGWETRAAAEGAAAGLAWDLIAEVAKPLTLGWDLRSEVATALALAWDLPGGVDAAALGLEWDLRAEATGAGLGLVWALRGAALGVPAALVWDTAGAVDSAALSLLWDLVSEALAVNGPALALAWEVRGETGASLALAWDLASEAAAGLALAWNLRGLADGPPLALAWDLRASLDAAALALAWDACVAADGAARGLEWDLRASLAATLLLLWDLEAADVFLEGYVRRSSATLTERVGATERGEQAPNTSPSEQALRVSLSEEVRS